MIPTLETERLVLRALRLDDAPSIQRYFARWEIIQHLTNQVPWPYPDDGAFTWLRDVKLPQVERGECLVWGITERGGNDDVIGIIEFRIGPEVKDNRGFWLAVPFQGRGYMTEAITAFQDHVFFELGVERFFVHNALSNIGSRRVKEKTGAVKVGMGTMEHRSGEVDTERWEVTRERWAALRGR